MTKTKQKTEQKTEQKTGSKDASGPRIYQDGPFTVTVSHQPDADLKCSTEWAANNYDTNDPDLAKYFKHDKARYEAWLRDEWTYVGVCVDIRLNTASNWADGGPVVGRASVWGIESDSDQAYLKQTEDEITADAWLVVRRLRYALGQAARQMKGIKVAGRVNNWTTDYYAREDAKAK
jgi:hypothetical protein